MTTKEKSKHIEKASKEFLKLLSKRENKNYESKCTTAADVAMKHDINVDFFIKLMAKHDTNTLYFK